MIDTTWETDDASLAITVMWGDVALHTAHHAPPRSFFLGDSTADCVLPDSAVGPDRAPLILVERGAVYLVLHPSMDPEGTITAPGKRARTVADLARPGMAEASADVPGAFLVELAQGATASLSIGDFAITITLETKAARAVDRDLDLAPRVVPLHVGSAALHLAALGVAALFTPAILDDPRDFPTADQIYFIQQALERVDEKEYAAIAEAEGEGREPAELRRPPSYRTFVPTPPQSLDYFGLRFANSLDDDDVRTPSPSGPADPGRARRNAALAANPAIHEGNVNSAADPRDDAYSMLPLDADLTSYTTTRRSLFHGEVPDPSSIHAEAFLNSVDYAYAAPAPSSDAPFIVHLGAAPSPFEKGHHLLRVGIQGQRSADATHGILARDLKIQVELNPRAVRRYRLIGFENHAGRNENARYPGYGNDKIAAGHTVTAVYDVVLATTTSSPVTVRLRFLRPSGGSRLEESVFTMAPRDIAVSFDRAPRSLRLAAALAGFAEILRHDPYAEAWRLDDVERVAADAASDDAREQELVSLIRRARSLDEAPASSRRSARAGDASLMGF